MLTSKQTGLAQGGRLSSAEPGGYDIEAPGWKYNMTDMQAALGLVQLKRLEEFIERRTLLADGYDRLLSRVQGIERPGRAGYPVRPAWHLYPVLLAAGSASQPPAVALELQPVRRDASAAAHAGPPAPLTPA